MSLQRKMSSMTLLKWWAQYPHKCKTLGSNARPQRYCQARQVNWAKSRKNWLNGSVVLKICAMIFKTESSNWNCPQVPWTPDRQTRRQLARQPIKSSELSWTTLRKRLTKMTCNTSAQFSNQKYRLKTRPSKWSNKRSFSLRPRIKSWTRNSNSSKIIRRL